MSEHPTIEFIFDKVSKDEVIFPRGDILSDELPLESDFRFVDGKYQEIQSTTDGRF